MRKLILLFFLFILFISQVNAAENFIKVKVAGRGVNQIEALEDAFKNAVRKAVGAYVVTQSKLRNEDFDESIYINADAVVTQHRVLDKKIEDGLIVVQIEATVVKNNLLKYIPKKESSKIQDTDIANLLNKREALDNAVQSLEYIFKDFSLQIYKAKRIGNFSVAANDDVSSDLINLEMDYEISFDHQAYQKFKTRLQNLLQKFAVARRSGITDDWDNFYRTWNREDSIIYKFNDNNSWSTGTKIIVFIDEFSDKKTTKYRYTCYAIPNQIYQKIDELSSDFNVIVFNFYLSGENEPLKRYLKVNMSFFFEKKPHATPRNTIFFKNWMYIDVPNYSSQNTCKANFKETWRFTKEQVRSMKTCSLDIYAGKVAQYIWFWVDRDSWEMQDLARKGYLPAMLAMAERFDRESWYYNAALMGSRQAQEKLGWKNGGLGFEIKVADDNFTVWKGNKNLGITKGMIIKSINGNDVPNEYWEDTVKLSDLIGSFNAGDNVAVTFTNGKTINCTVLPLDILNISPENNDENKNEENAKNEPKNDAGTQEQNVNTKNENNINSTGTYGKEDTTTQEKITIPNIPTEYDTQTLYDLSKILQDCLTDEGFNISNENLEKLRKYHNFKATFSLAYQINEFFYCMTLIQDNLSYHRYLVPKENQKYVNKIIREQKCDFCKSNNRNKKKCSFCKDKQNDFLMAYTKQLHQELLHILQKHISDNL